MEVIAIGGSALSLLGEKVYSKDIDLCYLNCKSPTKFAQAVVDAGTELGISHSDLEIFHGFEMTLLEVPSFGERAIPYKDLKLKHIKLKIMNPVDIILSKIYRQEQRDRDDIKLLLDKGKVTLTEVRSRYLEILRYQAFDVRNEFTKKYESFIKDYKTKLNK